MKDASLRSFCERELNGIDAESIDKADPEYPHHRVYTLYLGLGQHINPGFFGWGGDPGRVFQYLDAHPEEFAPQKVISRKPIAELEAESKRARATTIGVVKMRAGDVVPGTADPDVPVLGHLTLCL